MTQQEEDKLREEFTKQFTSEDYFKRAFVEAPTKAVVDYWISKIKEREESLVERIRNMKVQETQVINNILVDDRSYNLVIDDIIDKLNQ